MKAELLFLGTGGSSGVPMIGCLCDVCQSSSSLNKRLRSSVLLRWRDRQVLIDAGPDLREQALRHRINRLDAVILTHAHFDHIGGLDDLRVYYLIEGKPLACLVSKETYLEIKNRSSYLLEPKQLGKSLPAQLDFMILERDFGDVFFQGLQWHFVSYIQGGQKVLGFRVGNLAYISDIREYSMRVIEEIKGIKTLVVSALRENPSQMHFSIKEAIEFSRAVGAERTWFTHMSHEVNHEVISHVLPSNISLAYDGLTIDFDLGSKDVFS
ncbi:MAG: MBL fold metallo-hydrolase [Simkania sp.]|nr:MBL fold metallo-hydrolase [Simkania sp.]